MKWLGHVLQCWLSEEVVVEEELSEHVIPQRISIAGRWVGKVRALHSVPLKCTHRAGGWLCETTTCHQKPWQSLNTQVTLAATVARGCTLFIMRSGE